MLFLVSAVLPFETTDLPNDEEEEIDPFAELEIGTNSPRQPGRDALAMFEEDDPLSALTDDGTEQKEDFVISFEADGAPELKNGLAKTVNSSEATYKLLLETVWVDDILDPSEVELLARKRDELGLTFERHLQLVREIIGG
tara:strand:- start:4519 stop:4941 length:423 start_codon:yes stop_codon:yes gene_type:complete